MSECAEEGCSKEASFQIPFYKQNGKQLIVDFYEFRCKDHMIYTRNEKKKWNKAVRDKTKKR